MNWYKKAETEQDYYEWITNKLILESNNYKGSASLNPIELEFVMAYFLEVEPELRHIRDLKEAYSNAITYYNVRSLNSTDVKEIDKIVEMGLRANRAFNFVLNAINNSNTSKETLKKIRLHPSYSRYFGSKFSKL